mgnify:CR=1 FL=1
MKNKPLLEKLEPWQIGAIVGAVWGLVSAFKCMKYMSSLWCGYEAQTIEKIMFLPGYLLSFEYCNCSDFGCLPYLLWTIVTGALIGVIIGYVYSWVR